MNEIGITQNKSGKHPSDGSVGLTDLLVIMLRQKKIMLGLPSIIALISIAVSFAMPNVYQANVKLLPPQQAQSSAAALLSQLGGVAGLATGIRTPNDLYIGMLKSRAIADKLIDRFDLKRIYKTESQEKARQILEVNTAIDTGKEGLISVTVEDRNQKLVANIANAYVDELIQMTKVLAITEAAQRRLFYEQQLQLSKDKLATAETTLKKALDTRGVISVDGNSRAIVETVGRLRAQISAKEIELNSMGAFVTKNNPTYQRAHEQLNSMRSEVSKLENGRPEIRIGDSKDESKEAGLENIKILRDLKYHQMLYELLAKQYEAARLDEARDPAIIQVLDSAVIPERKVKPKRVVIGLISLILGFLIALFWAFLKEKKLLPFGRPRVPMGENQPNTQGA